MGGVAADVWPAIDHGDLASRLDRIHRRAFAGWARAQNHYIVIVDSHIHP